MIFRAIGFGLCAYGAYSLFRGEWLFGGLMVFFGLLLAFGTGGRGGSTHGYSGDDTDSGDGSGGD